MARTDLPLVWLRLLVLPIFALFELTIAVLFFILPYTLLDLSETINGYSSFFGWLLSTFSILILIGLILLFSASFTFKKERLATFFHSGRNLRLIGFLTIFLIFGQIVTIAISQLYFTLFQADLTYTYVLILILSIVLPVILFLNANSEPDPEIIYAMSLDTPLRLQLAAFWMIFLTGVMQIFAMEWEFVIIGLGFLVATYFFFYLYRSAAILTPSLLIIHFGFSVLMAVLSFVYLDETIQSLINIGEAITRTQAILMSVFVFVVPGIISLILAQSFFRRWVLSWIRNVHPEPEMEIQLEMAD